MATFENTLNLQEYVYDFDVDGGAQGTIVLTSKSGYSALPVGAIIKDIHMYVETAMTSGGSATIALGDDDNNNGFLEATAMDTWSANGVHRIGEAAGDDMWDNTNDHKISMYVDDAGAGAMNLLIETADLTAGKLRFYIEFIMTKTQG